MTWSPNAPRAIVPISSARIASRNVDTEALRIGLVRVALERRRKRELVFDPVQPRGDDRREGEVRVDVATRDPRLHAPRRAVPHDPEAARPVVVSPGQRRQAQLPAA